MSDARRGNPSESGEISLVRHTDDKTEVYFTPTEELIEDSELQTGGTPIKLADLDSAAGRLRMYPLVTTPGARFLKPKHTQVRAIEVAIAVESAPADPDEFEGILEGLPKGFVRSALSGLGLRREYRPIVWAVEEATDCTELVLIRDGVTAVQGPQLRMPEKQFEHTRKELSRTISRGQAAVLRVRQAQAFNALAGPLGLDAMTPSAGRHPITQLLTQAAEDKIRLTQQQQDQLLQAAVSQTVELADRAPERLGKLRADVDAIALEALIKRFRAGLEPGQPRPESFWQGFFSENPFALHLAFGYPVVQIYGQASVGGRKLDGGGDKVADFLVRSATTSNVAVFEIKTPQSELLAARPYRSGIYGPHKGLSGAVSQVLDQQYQLSKHLVELKDASRQWDLESYAVRGFLVIGTTPEDDDRRKSLELFRNALKDVQVVTYDELALRLEALNAFLKPPRPGEAH